MPSFRASLSPIALSLILNAAFSSIHVCAQETPADVAPDIADMQVREFKAGGDEKKRYFVIRRPGEVPKTGWKTLFVLPGGDGSADFKPFITRIAKFGVPEGYLVVQLVAP